MTDKKRPAGYPLHLGVRIVQALCDLRDSSDSPVREQIEAGLQRDLAQLGPAPYSAAEHREYARQFLDEAQVLPADEAEKGLECCRLATTHAFWADDIPLAEQACRAYLRLRALIEQA